MISNRESAKRSRMRKQQHLDDLLNQVSHLQQENNEIVKRVDVTTQIYNGVAAENNILKAQVMELTDRLQSLNSVLFVMEEVSGFSMDIPELPDPLLKPWQLPCPSQPIMASANIFQWILRLNVERGLYPKWQVVLQYSMCLEYAYLRMVGDYKMYQEMILED
ncbi:hypothetical protein HHK36_012271 [Tetracentron sinense]|uniref:BZIP domain-containing protein n=1 Tax=Tetracentron sinense TaxID=13715 RepID=A0A834Z888_TETSI|nr:hypothetical protein HHK36_012271 [Tetracentron sinense]